MSKKQPAAAKQSQTKLDWHSLGADEVSRLLATPIETGLDAALQDFANCLRPGGLLLLQNRNFDRVLAQRQRWMEPQAHAQEGTEKLFIRFYDFDPDGRITFNMLTLQRQGTGGWTQQAAATRLLPLTHAVLRPALARAGFGHVEVYGSLQGEPFDPASSPNLVLAAYR